MYNLFVGIHILKKSENKEKVLHFKLSVPIPCHSERKPHKRQAPSGWLVGKAIYLRLNEISARKSHVMRNTQRFIIVNLTHFKNIQRHCLMPFVSSMKIVLCIHCDRYALIRAL